MKPSFLRLLLKYFFQGLLLIAPVVVTGYVLYLVFMFLDSIFPIDIPGLSLLSVVGLIILTGYLSSTFFFKPVFALMEDLLNRVPLIKLVYGALKDLFGAFVGEKKRFDRAVLVTIDRNTGMQKLGFITQSDLSALGIKGKVAVYLPHSYNISGNLFIVPAENITPIEGISSAEAMKFIVSGGIAGVGEEEKEGDSGKIKS